MGKLKYNPLLKMGFQYVGAGSLGQTLHKITYYEIIDISGTTIGSLQDTPTGAVIQENQFGEAGNSVLSTLTGSSTPTGESPIDSSGDAITANLDVNGDWTASDLYSEPVALIYSIVISLSDTSNVDIDFTIDYFQINHPSTFENIVTTTSNYTASFDDYIRVDASSGDVDIQLPSSSDTIKGQIRIKRIDTSLNKVNVLADGAELIEGESTIELAPDWSTYLYSFGPGWDIR